MSTPTATPANINLALAAIMKDLEPIAKAEKNEGQGFFFRGIQTVMNEVHPIFAAHGVVCMPSVKHADYRDAGLTKNGTMQTRAIITCGFAFLASDGSREEAISIGEAIDSADKATGKAMSMALKYALTQTFLIPTEDVVDADYYSPTVDAREELALRNRDKKIIESMIRQHLDDAELAKTDEEKKRLQGLAAELRCKLHDLDVAPSTLPDAKTVEAEVLPPAGKLTTKDEPKKWQDIECHVGKAGGNVLGKKLGDLIKLDASEKHVTNLVAWFQGAVGKGTLPQDATLWKAVQEAQQAWKDAQKPTDTSEPTPKPTSAAKATQWSDYTVTSKLARYNGRKLGDMTPEERADIQAALEKIDWTQATLKQRTLKTMLALAAAESGTTEAEPEPEHTRLLRSNLAKSKITEETFLNECKKAGWIADDATAIEHLTAEEASQLLSDWASVEAQTDTIPA